MECGPLPGLLLRSSASLSTETPGCNWLRKCDQVLGKLIVSPESTLRMGGSVVSNTPRRTVSLFDSTVWTLPSPALFEREPPDFCMLPLVSAARARFARLPNHGPTAASAPIKLLAWSSLRRERARVLR